MDTFENRSRTLAARLWRVWCNLRTGWESCLAECGLDLTGATEETLIPLLLAPIEVIRSVRGLEEFSLDGHRGIEPGSPARSLFYHALASPSVRPEGLEEEDYPGMADLEIVENCVYGAVPPSMAELRRRAAGSPLAIVVFAYEYATAVDTVHRCHADMCFSRTGISRVGNAEEQYLRRERGFFPASEEDSGVHVVPARYGAFVAMQKKGNAETFGPERFRQDDSEKSFWVPLHKLFHGKECIAGLDIQLAFGAHHVNEKIRKVHLAVKSEGMTTRWTEVAMLEPPFRITEELAWFDAEEGLLKPIPHPLVEFAKKGEEYVSFPVAANHRRFGASLWFPDDQQARHWPEFVHVKHKLRADGEIEYLPSRKDKSITDILASETYDAVNVVDYTADGWLEVSCPTLALEIPERVSAYSILAQPDFFPLVKQRDLVEWWENSVPEEIKKNLWSDQHVTPAPLTDIRLPANITLADSGFDSTDRTVTAVVGFDAKPGPPGRILTSMPRREATLSYRATSLFAPGWDIAEDFGRDGKSHDGTFFLSNYGLGSPFLEDALICAATGSFWPGAVPDTTRFFSPAGSPTVTPIFDEDIGWDGTSAPKIDGDAVIYEVFPYADYVKAILEESLDCGRFVNITLREYTARTMALARVYQVVGAATPESRSQYAVLSFRPAAAEDRERLDELEVHYDATSLYRIVLTSIHSTATPLPHELRQEKAKATSIQTFLADPSNVIKYVDSTKSWHVAQKF